MNFTYPKWWEADQSCISEPLYGWLIQYIVNFTHDSTGVFVRFHRNPVSGNFLSSKVPSERLPSDITYPRTRTIVWLVHKNRKLLGYILRRFAETELTLLTVALRLCYQGYYDPTKTKIVHLSMNPSSIAKQQRGEELEKLRKENDSLRRRLQLLEAGGCSPEDVSVLSKVSPEVGPSVVKQVEGQS